MLIDKNLSGLILIDVQEKLAPHVLNANSIIAGCEWLLKLSSVLSVPQLVSEQYPKGLKSTVNALSDSIVDIPVIDKTYFSCASDDSFMSSWTALGRKQAILIGIETHVCVMQTALELKQKGYQVFVVGDVVSARNELDHQLGLKRMRQYDIQIVTKEMVFFEWIRKAGTEQFKTLSQQFLK